MLIISACQNIIVLVTNFFSFLHSGIYFPSCPSSIFLSLSTFLPREPTWTIFDLSIVEESLVDLSAASSDALIFSEALSDLIIFNLIWLNYLSFLDFPSHPLLSNAARIFLLISWMEDPESFSPKIANLHSFFVLFLGVVYSIGTL